VFFDRYAKLLSLRGVGCVDVPKNCEFSGIVKSPNATEHNCDKERYLWHSNTVDRYVLGVAGLSVELLVCKRKS